MRRWIELAVLLAVGFALTSCGERESRADVATESGGAAPTNRIDLPASVRQNLGITWAEAKRGRLEAVESVPGEIVARPDRDWHLRAPVSGTVTAVAAPWQRVEAGEVLATLASADLAGIQAELYASRERAEETRMELARARAEVGPERALAATRERAAGDAAESVARAEAGWREAERFEAAAAERLAEMKRLREGDAVSAAALLTAQREALEAARTATRSKQDLNEARIHASQLALEAATTRARVETAAVRIELLATRTAAAEAAFGQRLAALADLCGTTAENLAAAENGVAAWARMRALELRAPGDGAVVEVEVAAGSFLDRDAEILRVVDPSRVLFRALLPEADVGRFPDRMEARVATPGVEGSLEAGDVVLRPLGDPRTRSVLLEATLENPEGRLRPGSSATALVVTRRAESEEVIIPRDCVVRDGLESVVFRRDPGNQDQVVRTVVALGMDSGGWVEVLAGVGAGDQLVLSGVHQLRATGLGKAAAGGHFHADGTWHEGDK